METPHAPTYSGRVDFALLIDDSHWHLVEVVISSDPAILDRARANLLLSAHALAVKVTSSS